jgi:hypothetical protein
MTPTRRTLMGAPLPDEAESRCSPTGVVRFHHRVTGHRAFTLLVRASQNTNRQLVEIARYLVGTGELTSSWQHARAGCRLIRAAGTRVDCRSAGPEPA